MTKKIAVLIDGGYLEKIFKDKCSTKENPRHFQPDDVIKIAKKVPIEGEEEIFRIYFYNAPPFKEVLINPLSGKIEDHSKSFLCTVMERFHRELSEKEFVALRLGNCRHAGWTLPDEVIEGIRTGAVTGVDKLSLKPKFQQKAVDMKIGLDVALLAIKKVVDRVALITADNDFIPAMKFARKEGLQVVLIQVAERLTSDMKAHADQVRQLSLNELFPIQPPSRIAAIVKN